MTPYLFSPSPSFGIAEHPFVTYRDAFTADEINNIINYCDSLEKQKATVGNNNVDDIIRRSNIAWVHYQNETQWIFDRMAWVARQLNGQFYKFDLYGFNEGLQYTTYDGDEEEYYSWHIDSGVVTSSPRKLSIILQLSDPAEYEGGSLEIYASSFPESVDREKGLVSAFPSFRLHRVSPVTKGIRRSLVAWACGPSFK